MGIATRPLRAAFALLLSLVLCGSAAWGEELDLTLYDALLMQHTRAVPDAAQTRVAYAALRTSADWKRLIASLAGARPDLLTERSAQLAFWINAYNIFAIDLLVRNPPVSSIRDLGSLLRPVWKREAGRVSGPGGPGSRAVTLDEIEHQVLRKMDEPRIHAAIVCASVSCPPLRREAYRASDLDAQLDDNLRLWLADPRKGSRFEPAAGDASGASGGTLRLSPIFDWFARDFAAAGGVLPFVRPQLPAGTRAQMLQAGSSLSLAYFDYDWSLNGTSDR